MGKHNLKRPSPVARWGFQGVGHVCIQMSFGQGCPVEIPKEPRLLLRQKTALWKLTLAPHCRGQHTATHWTLRSQVGAYMEYLTLCHNFLGAGCYSAIHLNRNVHTNPSLKPLTCYPFNLQNMLGLWWHRAYGSIPPMSDLIYGLLYENKSSPYTAWVTRNRRQDSLISNANLNITGLKKINKK